MTVLPGVLGTQTLRRTVQVRLGFESLRLPSGTLIFTVSRHRITKHSGLCLSRFIMTANLRLYGVLSAFVMRKLSIIQSKIAKQDSYLFDNTHTIENERY
ncbi:MAG: hypothetical protein V3W07_05755 [Syntrophobacteria bacterium]